MGLLHVFLNITVPPIAFVALLIIWPLLATLRLAHFLISLVSKESVRGKVVLITGASSGIGEHTAYQYAKHKAKLVLVARRDDKLKEVAERAEGLGAMDVSVIPGDVSKEEDCKSFIDETINKYGHLDHLVNNAGMSHCFLFEDTTEIRPLRNVMDITFWGNVYPTYYALPHLRRSHGKIIANSSVNSWFPMARASVYNAAKAAIFQFYETLRVELGKGVGITIVTHGVTESEMNMGKYISEEGQVQFHKEKRDILVGPMPFAYAEEVAKAMVSGALASDKYVQIPYWYSTFQLYKVFAPEVMHAFLHVFYRVKPPKSDYPLSKTMLDMSGAKEALYPSTFK